jgi:streptogramin lyase
MKSSGRDMSKIINRKLTALLAIASLVSGLVIGINQPLRAETTYSSVEKYVVDTGGDTYFTPIALPTSDGAVWYVEGGDLRRYDPTTNTSSPGYFFPMSNITRYRIMVGPDDNIYHVSSNGIQVFDTQARTTVDPPIMLEAYGSLQLAELTDEEREEFLANAAEYGVHEVEGEYRSCEASPYGDATFLGDKLVALGFCEDDDDNYTGLMLYDTVTQKWSFFTDSRFENFSLGTVVTNGAGQIALANESGVALVDIDCETGGFTVAAYHELDYDKAPVINMTGTPGVALDQKGNLYYAHEDYDEGVFGVAKLNMMTGQLTMIPDDDETLAINTMLARGSDDNIYYTTGQGIKRIDTTSDQLTTIYDNIVGEGGGYNPGVATTVQGDSIWTVWCDADPDSPWDCSQEYDAEAGLATFSITGGQYPNRDPYTCPAAGDNSDPDFVPNFKPPAGLVPGVPNSGRSI